MNQGAQGPHGSHLGGDRGNILGAGHVAALRLDSSVTGLEGYPSLLEILVCYVKQ
jgi:hypothetical protein